MSFEKINAKDTRPRGKSFSKQTTSTLSNETKSFMNRSEASSSRILHIADKTSIQPLPGRALHPRLSVADSFSSLKPTRISGLEPQQIRLVVENFRREQNQRLLSSLTIEDGGEGMRAKAVALAGSGAEIRRLRALHAVQQIESRNAVLRKTVELEAELVHYLRQLGIRAPGAFIDNDV